jgi:hypothetical protein
MRNPLIDAAQALHAALKEIIAQHPGGAADPEALRRIARLSAAARLTMTDPECRAAIRDIERNALALYSEPQQDVDALFARMRIVNALGALRRRLRASEDEARTPPPLSERAGGRDPQAW